MKNKTFSLFSKILRATSVFVIATLLSNLAGCCEGGGAPPGSTASVESDVQTEMNVDMSNPIAVDMAILFNQKMGNSEVADALVEARSIKRAEYQQKADDAKNSGDYEEAIRNYDQAIKYSDPSNTNQNSINDWVYKNTAYCYLKLAYDATDQYNYELRDYNYNKSADNLISAARYETGDDKAEKYNLAARFKEIVGKKSEACGLLKQAKLAAKSDAETVEIMKKQTETGCK